MNALLENISQELENLSNIILNSWTDNRTLVEVYGWNHPSLTRQELASLPLKISKKINQAQINELNEEESLELNNVTSRIRLIQTSILPHMFNGNGTQAIPAFITTINWIDGLINSIISWQNLNEVHLYPPHIAKRIRKVNAELSAIIPDMDNISTQIKLINDATQTAESLPTDLEELRLSREKVANIALDADSHFAKISEEVNKSSELLKIIDNNKNESEKLVAKCDEAYKITTTHGLAAAFQKRADNLSYSMWGWVALLIIALMIGGITGSYNFKELSKTLSSQKVNLQLVWFQSIVSVISIGAPLWFSWLSTKQITQRFKLSEDYAFKSTISKAYEGYRKEAIRIDPAFEARLFSSALTRLEEAPLRLVDNDNYGSPWQEFFSSKPFKEALSKIPYLKEKYITSIKGNKDLNDVISDESNEI